MTDRENPQAGLPAPEFTAERLLVIGTGAVHVAHLPTWAGWLRRSYPHLEIRTVVTRSAERFVTRSALAALGGGEVLLDAWPEGATTSALHVELAQWADAVAVYPATMDFIRRFATGAADTPAMLALQCTRAPIAIAPALPPGGQENEVLRGHLTSLDARRNVTVVPTVPGRSITTGRDDAAVPPPLPVVISQLVRKQASLLPAGGTA
ncbi:flavoprotein [Streptomyces luteireticuli]|uniref:Flavoprotein domain-containing protein n=1 Tax=Streptomyces luteireticuli TaxID=173858 RepID=A0ABN0Y7D6_9ACTN